MGRPRGGKARRPSSQATKTEDADAGSGDDEAVIPAYKRRGRPQRHFKADTDEEDDNDDNKVESMEDNDGPDGAKPSAPSNGATVENGGMGKKRRRRQLKRGSDPAAEEKDDQPVSQVGFRHHGSRRKSTPRRAAEAGVEGK